MDTHLLEYRFLGERWQHKTAQEGEMTSKSRWLERLLHADKERAERRPTEDFAAYRWDGTSVREEAVRDVSSTGVFVLTSERWPLGKTVWMTLQRRGTLELDTARRMTAQTRVTRPMADGAGCMFVSEAEPKERVWEELVEHAATVTGVHDINGYVKAMAAVAFLRQICPDTALLQLMRERLSSMRLRRALEMLGSAWNLVRGEEGAEQLRAPGSLVERILDVGTDGQGGKMAERWATLLARCCTAEGGDESVAPLIEVMQPLTDVPLLILADVCERARSGAMKPGPECAAEVSLTLEELMGLTDMRELPAQQSLQVLADIGLLQQKERLLVFKPNARVEATPSALGLRTFAAMSRHRGTAEEFYGQPA